MYDTPEKDVLVLNYTLACPLSCDFCCYGCHPKRKEKMPLASAMDLISQAARMSNFTSVGLTGGEVFMFQDELIALAKHMKTCGLPFTVATAGHWAASVPATRALARLLADNGLKRANISCDHSHEKFVPREFVVRAAEAFAEHNVPVYIIGTFEHANQSLESFLPALANRPGISLRTKQIAKIGRAKKAQIQYEDIHFDDANKTCYRRVHHDVVVFWDGEVYPCCSTFNRATKALSIGNAFQTPLEEIWKRLEFSSMFRKMKVEGFGEILDLVARKSPTLAARLPALRDYPGACSYCNSIFSDSQLAKDLRSFFSEYEVETLLDGRKELAKLLGEETVARLFLQSFDRATKGSAHGQRSV